jgi:hypothetical protein
MVGQLTLNQHIGVRIPEGQPNRLRSYFLFPGPPGFTIHFGDEKNAHDRDVSSVVYERQRRVFYHGAAKSRSSVVVGTAGGDSFRSFE